MVFYSFFYIFFIFLFFFVELDSLWLSRAGYFPVQLIRAKICHCLYMEARNNYLSSHKKKNKKNKQRFRFHLRCQYLVSMTFRLDFMLIIIGIYTCAASISMSVQIHQFPCLFLVSRWRTMHGHGSWFRTLWFVGRYGWRSAFVSDAGKHWTTVKSDPRRFRSVLP